MNYKNIPQKIYLQIDNSFADMFEDFNELYSESITWSEDKINVMDIEYIRSPQQALYQQKQEIIKILKGDYPTSIIGQAIEKIEAL